MVMNMPVQHWTKDHVVKYINKFDQRTRFLLGIFAKKTSIHIGILTIELRPAPGEFLVNMLIGEPEYRNKGVATEITMPFRDHLFETLGLTTMRATVLAHNGVINHYLCKTGWKLDGTVKGHVKSHSDGAMLDWATMTRALERQAPWWQPGTAHGYHVNTFGYLVGEVVRRTTGTTLGSFLRTEVTGPLGADVHIGLPASEHGRAAEFLWPAAPPAPDRAALTDDQLMRWNVYWNPPGLSGAGWVNTAAWRAAEIPSTNGHGTARGVARVYAALARWGAIDGVRILAAPRAPLGGRRALVRPRPGARAPLPLRARLPADATGAPARAERRRVRALRRRRLARVLRPEADLAFGYVMNDMGPRWQNPRNRALIDAVYACL